MVLDILREESAADSMVGLGLLGAAGAAVTGAAQWQDTTNDEAPRRLGTLHALLNYTTTGLMLGSYVMRKSGRRGPGVALSTAGVALSAASGWLGGELAYGLGIGVDHSAFEKPPTKWTEAAALDDLQDGKPLRVETDDAPVMLLRQGGEIHAIAATCPHLGGPLDEGKIEGETVACPWHNSVFSVVNGAVLHGPATMPVTAYEVRVESGKILIRANAAQPGGKVLA
jgi:nitrite reductase/ring-hydroxylating ferredoxin subunit